MKPLCIIIAVSAMTRLVEAQESTVQVRFEEQKHVSPGSSARLTSKRVFTAKVAAAVEDYFRQFRSERFGLPTAYFAKLEARDVPLSWRSKITSEAFILERERPYLTPAPTELGKVLPNLGPEIRYYVAGSNVVALDRSFKVLDGMQVPTIKICGDY